MGKPLWSCYWDKRCPLLQRPCCYCRFKHSKKLQGYLLFATCSVYENENEKNIAYLLATGKFKLIQQQYFIGYDKHADTLFGALLQKIAD